MDVYHITENARVSFCDTLHGSVELVVEPGDFTPRNEGELCALERYLVPRGLAEKKKAVAKKATKKNAAEAD